MMKLQNHWCTIVVLQLILMALSSSPSLCHAQSLRAKNKDKDNHAKNDNEIPRQLADDSSQSSPYEFEWSYEFVKRGAVGFNLTLIVKDDYLTQDKIDRYNTQVFQSFQVFDDLLNDRTAVAKYDNVCYLAIRGQERNIPFDIWQTLSPFVQNNAFDSGCSVKRAFLNAYNACFAGQMLQAVDDCVKSCAGDKNGEQCPLVLNGHSTGGASVTIAALDPRLKPYNPIIYAYGPIRGIVSEDCQDDGLKNLYRIVAANSGYYDAASTSNFITGGRHYGQFFIMDELKDFYYIGPVDNHVRSPDNYNIHGLEVYSNRIQALANRPQSDFPITLSPFPNGHWCNYDDECQSGLCSSTDKYCTTTDSKSAATVLRLPGAPCSLDNQCSSGRCILEKCALPNGKVAEGSPCLEHDDCDTGKCSSGACISKFYDGSFCSEDWECEGTCTGPLSVVALLKHRCEGP